MGTLIVEYPSESKPDRKYKIMLSDDGTTTYCDCWQWKINKTCKHLERYFIEKEMSTRAEKLTRAENLIEKRCNPLAQTIDEVVAMIKGGR